MILFELMSRDDEDMYLFHYRVSYEGNTLRVSVMGIDTADHCGPYSNIDLVYFMWDHYLRFTYKKYAIALSPLGPKAKPELMFLKYFRTQCDGWKDSGNCDECIDNHQVMMLPFHVCDLSLENE